MTIERIERRPADEERLTRLRELFPEVFTDGRVDLARLAELLQGDAETLGPGDEHYGLDWPGKQAARRQAGKPATGTLRPAPGEGVDEDTTRNLLIVGDNLEVLRILQESYANRVKLIYIDPPYNTGNDFIYKDDFKVSEERFLEQSGQADGSGRLTSNPKSSGRFHSDWLSFMYPRLRLARGLLDNDGFIVVSIDDGEVHRLRSLLDELFGEANFIANIVWQKAYVANMTAKFLSATHDHILVYAMESAEASVGRVPRTDEQIAKFENPDNDVRGPWKAENLSAGKFYAAGQFAIQTPTGKTVTPPKGRYWRCDEHKYKTWLKDNRITFGTGGDGRPMLKKFLSEVKEGLTPDTWWRHEEAGTNKEATIELKKLFDGSQVFDTPKPVRLLKKIIALFAGDDALVLDFFAGSGTTGDAVMNLNSEDGGTRHFILVQAPEETGSGEYRTIWEITRDRLRRTLYHAATKPVLLDRSPSTSGSGFKVMNQTRSNVRRWLPYEGANAAELPDLFRSHDGLVAGWKVEDLITEVMLLEGYPLDSSQEQSGDFLENMVYRIRHDSIPTSLLVCLDGEIADGTVEKLAEFEKDVFVCCERALSDALKVRLANVLHRVKTL